jgi:hypothetical protein
LRINKVEPDWTVYYDFFLKAEQKLTNKQARINTQTNEITFLLKDAEDAEKEIIKLLNTAKINKNSIGKIEFVSTNNEWKLMQLIQ